MVSSNLTTDELNFLLKKYKESMLTILIFFVLMIFSLSVVSYILYFRFPNIQFNRLIHCIPVSIVLLYLTVIYFVFVPKAMNFKKDIGSNRKEIFIGKIQNKESKRYKNEVTYFWTLSNNIKIETDQMNYDKFAIDVDLTICYTSFSKLLLSVESIT